VIEYEENADDGTATVRFGHIKRINYRRTMSGEIKDLSVVVPRSSYRASRDRDRRAAEELKRQLDDALSQVERLSDERDEWQERAERGEEVLAKYPQPLWDPATLRRSLFVIPDEDAATVDELKAVIVSQAREIARLKGESE
jgi:hypothetical protein